MQMYNKVFLNNICTYQFECKGNHWCHIIQCEKTFHTFWNSFLSTCSLPSISSILKAIWNPVSGSGITVQLNWVRRWIPAFRNNLWPLQVSKRTPPPPPPPPPPTKTYRYKWKFEEYEENDEIVWCIANQCQSIPLILLWYNLDVMVVS